MGDLRAEIPGAGHHRACQALQRARIEALLGDYDSLVGLIQSDTSEHYQEHNASIQAWLPKQHSDARAVSQG